MKHEEFIDLVDLSINNGVQKGILQLVQNGELTKNNEITIGGKKLYNFTSCSYLGLEHDSRLKECAIKAINKYGVQFSESRAYVSIELYEELEGLMSEIFNAPSVIAPTTTLAHASAIPVLLRTGDAIITDQQLHNSVQSGINIFRANCSISYEVLRHNRMDLLEKRIIELQFKFERIWYFADGIYSMFGDFCPVTDIIRLLNTYPNFYVYIDDAHAMSAFGERGKGLTLASREIHEKLIVISSMAKAFATGGGILVFPNKELARKVRTCGAPFNSSGPLQPATLGAAVASAKIHLTNEIYDLQNELRKRIEYAYSLFSKTCLPILSQCNSPIFFIGTSKADFAYTLLERMIKRGFLVNLAVFPAVSKNNSGIRFTITVLQTFEQIEKMAKALTEEYLNAMKENGYSLDQIKNSFRIN